MTSLPVLTLGILPQEMSCISSANSSLGIAQAFNHKSHYQSTGLSPDPSDNPVKETEESRRAIRDSAERSGHAPTPTTGGGGMLQSPRPDSVVISSAGKEWEAKDLPMADEHSSDIETQTVLFTPK
ncbi:hypothetical protein NQZ68_000223 [Dissostichus eleginoides]|nr:hypothetical protein NQZ68_000223 [Dissostichus eleginoides]